jgi:hypothetical protein
VSTDARSTMNGIATLLARLELSATPARLTARAKSPIEPTCYWLSATVLANATERSVWAYVPHVAVVSPEVMVRMHGSVALKVMLWCPPPSDRVEFEPRAQPKPTIALASALPVAAVPDMATLACPFPPPQPSTPTQALPPHATSVASKATQSAASGVRTGHRFRSVTGQKCCSAPTASCTSSQIWPVTP